MLGLRVGFWGDSPFVQIHIGLFAHQVGVAAPNTLDLGQGVHDFLLAIDVGVEETEDELEIALFSGDERCGRSVKAVQYT